VYVVLREHTHNFYNTQQYILQNMNSHYTTFGFILRISVVICYYSLVLPHLYNTVFGWQSAWLWICRQQSTQSHLVTPALSQCVLFFSGLNHLFKLDFVSSRRPIKYCCGIFSRSDVKIVDFASILRGRLATGSLHFHTPCVFVVMRHVSRLTASFKMCTSVMVVTYFRGSP